jgi:hypothetical protein
VIKANKDVIEFHDENSMMRNEKSIEKKARRRKQRCDKQITHAHRLVAGLNFEHVEQPDPIQS